MWWADGTVIIIVYLAGFFISLFIFGFIGEESEGVSLITPFWPIVLIVCLFVGIIWLFFVKYKFGEFFRKKRLGCNRNR